MGGVTDQPGMMIKWGEVLGPDHQLVRARRGIDQDRGRVPMELRLGLSQWDDLLSLLMARVRLGG